MQEALAINEALVAIVGALIGWGGFLILVWFLKGAVIEGFSLAAVQVIRTSNKDTQKWIIRCLVQKNLTLKALYKEMKLDEDAPKQSDSGPSETSEAA